MSTSGRTPRANVPFPQANDVASLATDIEAVSSFIDNNVPVWVVSNTTPSPSVNSDGGEFWWCPISGENYGLNYYNGSLWVNINSFKSNPVARIYANSITTTVETAPGSAPLLFDQTSNPNAFLHGGFDVVHNALGSIAGLIVPKTGYYMVMGNAYYAPPSGTTGTFQTQIWLGTGSGETLNYSTHCGSSTELAINTNSTNGISPTATDIVYAVEGQNIGLMIRQTSGSEKSTTTQGAGFNYLAATLISQ